jgi:hypothetical protein
MKTNLTIKDRVTIIQLFPQQSNFLDQVLVNDIKKKIEISQKTIKKINLRTEILGDSTTTRWDNEKEKSLDTDFEFSDAEIEFLKKQVDRLDKENNINQSTFDICKKIKEFK